ncbi:MAG: MerC domain-containing protein [Myxococcota bacterium]
MIPSPQLWLDRFGSVASATCAIHCLSLSVAPALISLLGLGVLASELFEWGFFAVAVSFAVAAAAWGYSTHRSSAVLLGFVAGVAVLVAGRLGEAFELYEGGVVFAVVGGGLLMVSHFASASRIRASHAECCE